MNAYHTYTTKGPVVYLIQVKSSSRYKNRSLHLASALMEYFLKGSAPSRIW